MHGLPRSIRTIFAMRSKIRSIVLVCFMPSTM